VAHLLGGENLTVSYATRTVLDGLTLGLEEGDRIGMVGRNGDGKSTLMRLLALRSTPDSGRVTKRGDVNVGYLDQSDVLDGDLTVGAAIVGDQADYEWARNPQIREVMGGLVSDVDWHANVHALSGGQKRRVALAKLLIEDHDVIMLDEPTNHLDVEGVAWLSRHLKTRWRANQGAFLVVTHDRWFLDEVCNKTWEIHDGIMDPFEGGYAAYVLARAERDRSASVMEGKRQQLVKKELAWLRRGAPARTAKPKFRIEAANALIADVPEPRDSMALSKMATARLGKDVLDLEHVSLDYLGGDPGQKLFDNITLRLAPGAGRRQRRRQDHPAETPQRRNPAHLRKGQTRQDSCHRRAYPGGQGARRRCRPARHRGHRAGKAFLQRGRQGIQRRPAGGAAWLHQREAVDPGPRPFRRRAPPPPAPAPPRGRTQRAHA
jgi:ATPase subunit of ABC transporter with duplicated ATPase domains